MKKLVTLLLVVAMVLGIVSSAMAATTPSTVAAAKFSDIAGNKAEGDITLLGVKGIMKGDAGATTVRPDSTISRAEFAAMVVRMLGKDTLAASLAQIKPTTKDEIPAWAWGYVNLATSMGIMKGYPDGTFLPNNNVTFAEALAMLERAIGLDKKAVGVWPTNYLVVAYDADLVDGVDVYADVPATRGDVAIMMVNTMYTDKFLGYKEDGTENTTGAILDATTVTGLVTAVSPDTNKITLAVVGDKTLAASVALAGAAKFSDLVNVNVSMVLVDSKVVYIAVTDSANVITGTFDSIVDPTGTDTNTYIKLANGNKYPVKDLAGGVTGKLNTVALANWTGVHDTLTKDDPIVLNLVDDKVVYVEVNRVNIQNALVKADAHKVNDTNYTIIATQSTGADTGTLKLTTSTPVTIDGVAKTAADLKANDVVYITTVGAANGLELDEEDNPIDATVIKVDAYRAAVTGTVVSTKTANGPKYTVTLKLADGTTKDYTLSVINLSGIAADNTITLRLNKDGKGRVLVGYTATNNVAYVVDKYDTVTSSTHKYYVVLDVNGSTKTVEVADYSYDHDSDAGTPNVTLYSQIAVKSFIEYTVNANGIIATNANIVAVRNPAQVTTGKVYAIDAANGIVVIKDGSNYYTFGAEGLSVYQDNGDTTFTSIGVAGLAKDDLVKYQTGKYDLLIRQDQ